MSHIPSLTILAGLALLFACGPGGTIPDDPPADAGPGDTDPPNNYPPSDCGFDDELVWQPEDAPVVQLASSDGATCVKIVRAADNSVGAAEWRLTSLTWGQSDVAQRRTDASLG